MFRFFNILAVCFVVLVLIAAFYINEHNTRARTAVKSPVEFDFQPGGSISFDLGPGEYHITGTSSDKIRVRYAFSDYVRETASISSKINSTDARITIDGPFTGFKCEIEVPQKSNLSAQLSAGLLKVSDVEGSKDFKQSAGLLHVDIGDPAQYKDVYAAVTSGNMQLRPWHAHRPGLFRSFSRQGSGPYALRARVTAGNLILTSDVDGDRPKAPLPPSSPELPRHYD